ncbi:MAG TPA: MFS transporter [Candidatus Baltobacteraceae bacterium]|jgi:MFS transporter, MHS family, citrate/tricarballylate:H+ symporter|nr:MFS transporter [Candidatus Baltobacteraceae bacterium]
MTEIPERRGSVPARHVAAVVAGNALEFYDFLTYSFFAVYIGRAFFPSSSPTASLLASLGTFGVGFVTRPIGGFVIGRMGDRLGRKPAMIFSFSLMGVAITGLALTPPHSMIGVAAPILVVFFRMIQGFALGGEVGPTTAFLLESAPAERRGFYAAFQYWTQDFSVLVSGLVGFTLANLMNEQQLQDYGWRIAFLVGAAIVPFGLMLRRSLPETFHANHGGGAERVSLRPYLAMAGLGVALLASGTIATYTADYMTTYAIATLHMRANVAFAATVVVGLCGVTLDLLSGALSDHIGRRTVMLLFGVPLLFSILPAFYAISHYRSTAVLLGATAVMAGFMSMTTVPVIIWLTESFPAAIRSSGVAVIYALSIAVFGGTTQYSITWLIRATGNPLAPAWYWTVAAALGVGVMIATRETAPRKLAKREVLPIRLPTEAD